MDVKDAGITDPNPIRAILFDLFGTLVPVFSFAKHEQMMAEMAAALNVPKDPFRDLWVSSYRDRLTGRFDDTEQNIVAVCRSIGRSVSPDSIHQAVMLFKEFTGESLKPSTFTLDLLCRLKQKGFLLGVVSNCSPEVPILWHETSLADKFHTASFSCTVGQAKPAPGIYLSACRRLSVLPGECMYIGDGSSLELLGAQNLGMRTVLLIVSTADTYDSFRKDVQEWRGERINDLGQIEGLLKLPDI